MNDSIHGRRKFLRDLVVGFAAVSVAESVPAGAADVPHLAETDANAKALGYVETATKIDPAKEVAFKKGSHCGVCSLFQAAAASGGYGPCAAFPGKTVNANGWCRAFAAKA